MRRLFAVVALVLVFWSARAEKAPPRSAEGIPQLIHHQGLLTDDAGEPFTGDLEIEFALYSDSLSGVLLWSEVQPAVHIDEGFFNVYLGHVTAIPGRVLPLKSWT